MMFTTLQSIWQPISVPRRRAQPLRKQMDLRGWALVQRLPVALPLLQGSLCQGAAMSARRSPTFPAHPSLCSEWHRYYRMAAVGQPGTGGSA